jgi:hypothetical protein
MFVQVGGNRLAVNRRSVTSEPREPPAVKWDVIACRWLRFNFLLQLETFSKPGNTQEAGTEEQ